MTETPQEIAERIIREIMLMPPNAPFRSVGIRFRDAFAAAIQAERTAADDARRDFHTVCRDHEALRRRLEQTEQELAALKEKDAAWEAVASGMADVIRRRGEALAPFARFCEVYDYPRPLAPREDEDAVYIFNDVPILLGDLRRARAVLAPEQEKVP